MATEEERKFLPKNPFAGFKNDLIQIEQGYLMLGNGKQLRVRLSGKTYDNFVKIEPFVYTKAEICYKQNETEIKRHEFEYEIPLEDGLKLLELAEDKILKIRNPTHYNELHLDIDTYPDFLSTIHEGYPMQVIEIEFEGELAFIPPWCGAEITGISEFSNIALAKQLTERKKNEHKED